MFIPELQHIYSILSSFLGEAKNGFDGKNLQLQFPCPHCIETKGEQEKLKYNLEVNLQKGVFQCWSCQSDSEEMYGTITKLIKKYGNGKLLKDYVDTITSFRSSDIYKLHFNDNDFKINNETEVKKVIDFPNTFIPLLPNTIIPKDVSAYLKSRGLNWDIINRFNLGYTRFCSDKKQYRWSFRIVLPSYDAYSELNYCVGRDYTGKSKNKYYNAKTDKKAIIFNEEKIQWDADITLVEGPFDHIVVPNSIPLLGKHLDKSYKIYQELFQKANANINIWLDKDAFEDAQAIYHLLNQGRLKDKIRIIYDDKLDKDASEIYQKYGNKGIMSTLQLSKQLN